MNQDQERSSASSYEPPRLVVHGDVQELTEWSGVASALGYLGP